jgi:hypothetical protein
MWTKIIVAKEKARASNDLLEGRTISQAIASAQKAMDDTYSQMISPFVNDAVLEKLHANSESGFGRTVNFGHVQDSSSGRRVGGKTAGIAVNKGMSGVRPPKAGQRVRHWLSLAFASIAQDIRLWYGKSRYGRAFEPPLFPKGLWLELIRALLSRKH